MVVQAHRLILEREVYHHQRRVLRKITGGRKPQKKTAIRRLASTKYVE
jgi:hypothetical protein